MENSTELIHLLAQARRQGDSTCLIFESTISRHEAAQETPRTSRAYLYEQFASMDLDVTSSAANLLIVRVGDAARIRAELHRFGIVVRNCPSFGLSGYIGVAVRTAAECAQLVNALRRVLGR